MTASKDSELREKATNIGAIEFFEKPFDTENVLETIQRVLDR